MTAPRESSRGDDRLARRSVLAVAAAAAAGCVDGRTVATARGGGVGVETRRRILDHYAAGRAIRREASRSWTRGSDAWEGFAFGRAAAHWSHAGDRFEAAGRRFEHARSASDAADLPDARDICSAAREYCDHMHGSAEEHATAAGAYETGAFDVGDRHLDRGYERYVAALDYRIAPADRLEEAIDAGVGEG